MSKIYAMYKGEQCLAIGTIIQLSKELGVSIQTIRFYLTPSYKKRVKKGKNRRELIKVE